MMEAVEFKEPNASCRLSWATTGIKGKSGKRLTIAVHSAGGLKHNLKLQMNMRNKKKQNMRARCG